MFRKLTLAAALTLSAFAVTAPEAASAQRYGQTYVSIGFSSGPGYYGYDRWDRRDWRGRDRWDRRDRWERHRWAQERRWRNHHRWHDHDRGRYRGWYRR